MTAAAPIETDDRVRSGLAIGLGAYLLWGFFPVFLKLLQSVNAGEILAHRIIWAVPFGALLITVRKQWSEVRDAFTNPKILRVLIASALAITVNWLLYIWAIINDQVMAASLGYYINPLMFVAAGVFVIGERLRPMQTLSVAIATLGVIVMTIGIGAVPWVALALAVFFTAYGYLRKTVNVGAMPGLFIETTLLAPLALAYAIFLGAAGQAMFFSGAASIDALLVLSGPVTVIPLLCFALAARRLTLTTLGFIQYIAPTIQLLLAVYYGEAFTPVHAATFGLIWLALAIFSIDAVRHAARA